jgi:DNA processing protein
LSPIGEDGLRAWLSLASASGVGPRTLARLLEGFGDPQRVLSAGGDALAAAGASAAAIAGIRAPRTDLVEVSLEWARLDGAHILVRADPRYPPLLDQLPDAPAVLYVRGDPQVLADPQLAVVGSRNPTPAGRETTRELARHLAACGLTITSGLAIGVDGAAHEGALEAGRTVAVMGTGPDRIYPAAHRDLARRIAEGGALVTEFPPGSEPRAENFPRRNRIISGLCVGTLVTEAALRSGSLITARYAGEQGREVFAVPGSIHNPLARGCHALIRDGAKLVETAHDILEELAPQLGALLATTSLPAADGTAAAAPGLDVGYRDLLDAIGHDPVAPDELIRRTGLPANDVASMLLLLELEGHVSSYPGGRYCRAKPS